MEVEDAGQLNVLFVADIISATTKETEPSSHLLHPNSDHLEYFHLGFACIIEAGNVDENDVLRAFADALELEKVNGVDAGLQTSYIPGCHVDELTCRSCLGDGVRRHDKPRTELFPVPVGPMTLQCMYQRFSS